MQKRSLDVNSTWPPLHDLPVLERARGDAPLHLAGQRMLIGATADNGVAFIHAHPRRVLFDMRTGAGEVISRTPAELIRQIRIGDTDVTEHISVSPAEPVAVWCWRAGEDVEATFAWNVAFGRADGSTIDPQPNGATLRIVDANGAAAALFAFSEIVDWSVEPGGPETLRVTARLHLPAGRDVWLMMTFEPTADRTANWQPFPDPTRPVVARASAFRKRARELMRIAAPDDRVAPALASLIDRVETSLIELPQGIAPIAGPPTLTGEPARTSAVDACTIATASAALGPTSVPRATLRFLHATRTANGLVPAEYSSDGACADASEAATAAWLSLAARYHAWSADDNLLRELWPDLARAARAIDGSRFGNTLRALALTAESLGDSGAASDFRRAAAAAPAPLPGRPLAPARANVRAAQHLLKLVDRVLGLDPDAPRGRLRARLATPSRWATLRIDNVRLGDARIRLDVEQDSEHTRIVATPTAGAIPIRLILEAVLRRVPARVLIDARTAQLDLQPLHNRIVAPVQLELDHPRTIEFHFE